MYEPASNSLEDKYRLFYEYNQIKQKVEDLLKKKEKLNKKQSDNNVIAKARKITKKNIEFHKYWINILKEIIFYLHITLSFVIVIVLFYKLF